MFSGKSVALGALMAAAFFVPSMASASQILNVNSGPGLALNGTSTTEGESFLTPTLAGDSGWDDITFNWYTGSINSNNTISGLTALANGDLFILTQAYTGTPGALSSSTAGFVAESTGISGGVYDFASGVTLNSDTEYYVYADVAEDEPIVSVTGGSADFERFRSVGGGDFQGPPPSDGENLFDVTGSAVPEPATWAMFLVGFGAVGFMLRGSHRKSAVVTA
jgi:hypothetical protein